MNTTGNDFLNRHKTNQNFSWFTYFDYVSIKKH
jgi:hypothetical protein